MYKCPFMPCMNCPYSTPYYMQAIPTMQGMQSMPNANMPNTSPIEQMPNMPNVSPIQQMPNMPNISPIQQMPNMPNTSPIEQMPNMPNVSPIQQMPNMPNVSPIQQMPNMPNVSPIQQMPKIEPMQQSPNVPNMQPTNIMPEMMESPAKPNMQNMPIMDKKRDMENMPMHKMHKPNMPEDDMEAYIRVLHASPDAPPVDIYINGSKAIDDLAYGMLAGYIPIVPGKHKIEVYPINRTTNPIISASLNFDEDSFTTIAAVNRLASIEPLVINDFDDKVQRNMSMVKFVHMSPNSPAVDIVTSDGRKLFSNISFKQISDYISLNPGTYSLQVKVAGTDKVALNLPNITIRGGVPYSIYAIGLSGTNPPLTAVLVEDEI